MIQALRRARKSLTANSNRHIVPAPRPRIHTDGRSRRSRPTQTRHARALAPRAKVFLPRTERPGPEKKTTPKNEKTPPPHPNHPKHATHALWPHEQKFSSLARNFRARITNPPLTGQTPGRNPNLDAHE